MHELFLVTAIVLSALGFLGYNFYQQVTGKKTSCSGCSKCKHKCHIQV
jgi:RsiW-degrading membrane proteinase PrsW (M82 family)